MTAALKRERERTGLQGLARKPDEQAVEDEWMNGR